MSFSIKKTTFKTLKITFITIVSLLLLLFALPYLFPQTINTKIKQWANGSINGQLAFSGTGLSFFKHFPGLTFTLYDFSLKGSAPFQNDTLVAAKEVSFGIDLSSVFQKKITINKIFLNEAFINIQSDSAGNVNYNVYKGKNNKTSAAADTSSASLGINQILIENSRFVYNDRSIPMQFNARGVNYTGSGDLSKDVFDLHTHTQMASVDFIYNNQAYVLSKKIDADLVTRINTKSLAFEFQKNDLMINQLPVEFIGKFAFLKDGYDMNFSVNSHESNLHDIITALPPEYLKWLENTDVKGTGNLQLQLAGKYIAKQNIMPGLGMSFKIRNGYISNQKSPVPVSNLYLDFETKLPGLNPDSLQVNLDSLYFNMGKDYLSTVLRVKGVKKPDIYAKINTELDLEKWSAAFGVKPYLLKGRYSLHLLAKGKYVTGIKHSGIRKVETVITSIPQFNIKSSFRNGYFKYASLPEGLSNISFDMNASCPDNNYKHATFEIQNLNANVLENYLKGYFKLSMAPGFPMDSYLKAKFNLADIKKVYPVEGMEFSGNLLAGLQTKGKYLPEKRIFPQTKANISLQNGSVQTKYYPHPIQNIQVNTEITDNTGSMEGLRVVLNPVSLVFEDKPFSVAADLKNFNNLEYNIQSKGTLDIGKIYQVFAVKGYNVNGFITTNLSLKGKQSDAMGGNYSKLTNSGSMAVKNIALTSDLFPKPFIIKNGTFSFNQDKMNFDAFRATYGKSVIILNGALSNVIGYATKPNDTLKGNFNFGSSSIIADDFMAFASPSPNVSAKPSKAASGVIMVPRNLNLNFTANVKKVKYQGLELDSAKGQMMINNGSIILKQTGFNLIGAPVTMDATYTSIDPKKATFDYHINAKEFDIKKAYKQVKLFHDMASSAANAEGIVSLDYKLSGRLNSNMQPVYPSLKGGGVLSVKKVKLNGFKLFSSVGNKTDHKGIDSGDVSKVNIETTIANNIITIKQTKIRMAGFRLKFDGQVSFENALNLHFRLGLPPFGIFGIPMTITGTQAKPVIHLGNGKKEDELKETDDSDTGN
jgi:AsmA protein